MILLLLIALYVVAGLLLVSFGPNSKEEKKEKETRSWQEVILAAHGKGDEEILVIKGKQELVRQIFKLLTILLWPLVFTIYAISSYFKK